MPALIGKGWRVDVSPTIVRTQPGPQDAPAPSSMGEITLTVNAAPKVAEEFVAVGVPQEKPVMKLSEILKTAAAGGGASLEKRVTAKKWRGDDEASWAVFIDGRPFVTGLTKREVAHYKQQAINTLKERQTKTASTVEIQALSSEPTTRALERMWALVERGEDVAKGTLKRLNATSDPGKISGIYWAAKKWGLADVAKAASKKYQTVVGKPIPK